MFMIIIHQLEIKTKVLNIVCNNLHGGQAEWVQEEQGEDRRETSAKEEKEDLGGWN